MGAKMDTPDRHTISVAVRAADLPRAVRQALPEGTGPQEVFDLTVTPSPQSDADKLAKLQADVKAGIEQLDRGEGREIDTDALRRDIFDG